MELIAETVPTLNHVSGLVLHLFVMENVKEVGKEPMEAKRMAMEAIVGRAKRCGAANLTKPAQRILIAQEAKLAKKAFVARIIVK